MSAFAMPSYGPTETDVTDIIGQPILRNLRITQCYHDLSTAMAGFLGAGNANWCTFATWASKTAGNFIRDEEVFDAVRPEIEKCDPYKDRVQLIISKFGDVSGGAKFNEETIMGTVAEVAADVGSDIAAGNLKVFAELAPIFAGLNKAFADAAGGAALNAQALCEPLTTGPTGRGGQGLLRDAITHYCDALRASGRLKAQLMLLANAKVGLHEQIRLQSYISGSLRAPVADLLKEHIHHKVATGFEARIMEAVHNFLDTHLHPLASVVETIWVNFATGLMMTLKLPDCDLHLGQDLMPNPGQSLFPAELNDVSDHSGLHALLTQFDACNATTAGTGAHDWSNLAQRMRYILTLFRSRQQDSALLGQPFSDAQRFAIAKGQIPEGPL